MPLATRPRTWPREAGGDIHAPVLSRRGDRQEHHREAGKDEAGTGGGERATGARRAPKFGSRGPGGGREGAWAARD